MALILTSEGAPDAAAARPRCGAWHQRPPMIGLGALSDELGIVVGRQGHLDLARPPSCHDQVLAFVKSKLLVNCVFTFTAAVTWPASPAIAQAVNSAVVVLIPKAPSKHLLGVIRQGATAPPTGPQQRGVGANARSNAAHDVTEPQSPTPARRGAAPRRRTISRPFRAGRGGRLFAGAPQDRHKVLTCSKVTARYEDCTSTRRSMLLASISFRVQPFKRAEAHSAI